MITQSLLLSKFDLHADGYLVRKTTGKRVGCTDAKGYRVVMIDGITYKEHRLIWLMVHGELPSGMIDHKNNQKQDNRPCNLRDVSNDVNQMNPSASIGRKSQTGLLGVSIDPSCKSSYRAKIKVSGRQINLGSFPSPELAQEAYFAAKALHHR